MILSKIVPNAKFKNKFVRARKGDSHLFYTNQNPALDTNVGLMKGRGD